MVVRVWEFPEADAFYTGGRQGGFVLLLLLAVMASVGRYDCIWYRYHLTDAIVVVTYGYQLDYSRREGRCGGNYLPSAATPTVPHIDYASVTPITDTITTTHPFKRRPLLPPSILLLTTHRDIGES